MPQEITNCVTVSLNLRSYTKCSSSERKRNILVGTEFFKERLHTVLAEP